MPLKKIMFAPSDIIQLSAPPPPSKRMCISTTRNTDNCKDLESTVTSLSWDNFPVVIHCEAHPSTIVCTTNQANEAPLNASDNNDILRIVSSHLESNQKRKEHPTDPEKSSVVSFGWSDFPLLTRDESFTILPPAVKNTRECSVPICGSSAVIDDESTTSSETTISFGWSDFPLLVQENTPLPSIPVKSSVSVTPPQPKVDRKHFSPRTTSVRFTNVQIREYGIDLGDHPLCPSFPITTTWDYGNESVMDIDEYENHRVHSVWVRMPRRMDVMERRLRLSQTLGISEAEVDIMEKHRQERLAEEANSSVMDEDDTSIKPCQLTRIPTVHELSCPLPATTGVTSPSEVHLVDAIEEEIEETENLLEMSMHIGCHVAHPGFGIVSS